MNLVDREELGTALAYLTGALPCRTKGITLTTRDGHLVGQFLSRQDGHQIAALLRETQALARRLAGHMGDGPFHYNLNAGANGMTLTLVLDDTYLVCISVVNVKSIDALLNAVREGLPPLLDVLGLR